VPEGERSDTVENRIKAEKLRQAQFLSSTLEMEDKARHGVYVDAKESAGEIIRVASEMMKICEGALPDFASAHAAKFQISQRESLHLLRTEFRKVREQMAAVYAAAAAEDPKTVEVPE
jgi:hypothetical protein